MDSVVSNSDRIAIAEVDYIIHHMNERYLNKIPQKILDYITILKKKNVEIYVDPKVPLEEQGLKEFTLYFLMILNLKYWCDDERRKEILSIMEKNQKQIDDKVNNIFEQAESMRSEEEYNNVPRQIKTVSVEIKEDSIEENEPQDNIVEENSIAELPKENFFIRFLNKLKLKFKSKKV